MEGYAFATRKGLEFWAPTKRELIDIKLETWSEKELIQAWCNEEYHIVEMSYEEFKDKKKNGSYTFTLI